MVSILFEHHHFAEGRFRLAYKGTYNLPVEKKGKQCVVKKMKNTCTWQATDWNGTLSILRTAKQLARGFNSYSRTRSPVTFVDVGTCICTGSGESRCNLFEYLTYEDYIPGDYVKWCNNYGVIDTRDTFLPAFMHWSWAHTKGETMIADLQGVKEEKAYYLTDPCLLSATHGGMYGPTDMGIEGMAMFFLNHKCTDLCKNIPKPGLLGISREQISTALRAQQQISTYTAYSHELSFTMPFRDLLIPTFKQIACTANV